LPNGKIYNHSAFYFNKAHKARLGLHLTPISLRIPTP
jgi:hypothetical protein